MMDEAPHSPPGLETDPAELAKARRHLQRAQALGAVAVTSALLVSMLMDGIVDDGVLGDLTIPAILLLALAWSPLAFLGPKALRKGHQVVPAPPPTHVYVWASHGAGVLLILFGIGMALASLS